MRKEVFVILYRMRDYEIVTKIIKDGKIDYIAKNFVIGNPVSDNLHSEDLKKFDELANVNLKMWNDLLKRKNDCNCESYISGSHWQKYPCSIYPKDVYWDCRVNRYSKSWVKNYFKYKKCIKKHKEKMVYFTEHVEDNFYTSSMTQEEIEKQRKGRDELIALCHWDNSCFIMSEINKGLWFAIKKDIKRIINKGIYIVM